MVTCKKQNKFMTITSTDFKSGRVISLWVGKCNVRYKQTNKYVLFIDDVAKDVNNVFYEAANLSLKQKPLRKSTSKPKQNVK